MREIKAEDKIAHLRNTYGIFGTKGRKKDKKKAIQELTSVLASLTMREMLQLENQFRCGPGYWYKEHNPSRWTEVSVERERYAYFDDEEYRAFLILGSFHANGYFRQKCVRELKDCKRTLPVMILRLNDWVDSVRESAFEAVMARISCASVEELFSAMPCIYKLEHSMRRKKEALEQVKKSLQEALLRVIPQMDLRQVERYELSVKNAFYRFIRSNSILPREQLKLLLKCTKSSFGKRILIRSLIEQYGMEEAEFREYVADRSSIVRRCAIEYWYGERREAWEGIENLLLDYSKEIRGLVRYIIEKHTDLEPLTYYLEQLEKAPSATAILGVGECGGREHAAALYPYLKSDNLKIRKSTLTALGNLLQEEGGELYWDYLCGSEPSLAKTAYLNAVKWEVYYDAGILCETFLKKKEEVSAKYFLRLLLKKPSWERLPYLLDLYETEDVTFRHLIHSGINCRFMFARVSAGLADRIREKLEEKKEILPEKLRKDILFDLKYVEK